MGEGSFCQLQDNLMLTVQLMPAPCLVCCAFFLHVEARLGIVGWMSARSAGSTVTALNYGSFSGLLNSEAGDLENDLGEIENLQ